MAALLQKALIAYLAIGAFLCAPASAQDGGTLAQFLIDGMPADHRQDARTLAVCLLAEAGQSRIDHAGILYVLQRRAGQLSERSGRYVSPPDMARR